MGDTPRSGRARRDDRAGAVRREVAEAAERLGLRGGSVLVAVSGGLDSTVLADALVATARRGGFSVAVGHVHHGLRGDEADRDEATVRSLAGSLGVSFVRDRIAPAAVRDGRSSRDRPTLQEAARTLRYAALADLAERVGATHVATAHHVDDQAETVLLRLFRGAGPDGLGGIPERSPDGRIVRPLLRVSRTEIEAYAQARGLSWREDASNAGIDYARNRLRHDWLPGLADAFNPRLLRAIADLAEAQRRDSEWIDAGVQREAHARFTSEGAWLAIDTKEWASLPEALARRLAREALRRVGLARHVERVHLERVSRFLERPARGRRIELPCGVTLTGDRRGARLGPHPEGSSAAGESLC